MDKLEFKGKWNEWKGKIKQANANLMMMIFNTKREKMMKLWDVSSKSWARPAMRW